jgi:hypothetical protein
VLTIAPALFLSELFLPMGCDQDCIAFENALATTPWTMLVCS